MTKDEALKLALETLEQLQGGCTDHDDGTVEAITVWCPEVIEAIEAALAQTEQEPTYWLIKYQNGSQDFFNSKPDNFHPDFDDIPTSITPLYTAPPQRPWVGLTDEELQLIYDMGRTYAGMMEMVEAKLKEKNFD